MRGLYIHIPFCVKKCTYCDFYSLPQRLDSLDAYIEAILTEAGQYHGRDFRTLYIGGGTPSLLSADNLKKLLQGLKRNLDLSYLVEASMEANPESVNLSLLDSAKASGVNRISIGVQSLSDSELSRVGRIHTAAQAVDAIELARKAGFTNISCDVILGLPGQDWQSLMVTLETLIALDIQHISLYCLSIEPHTPLALKPIPGIPSEDGQADLYEMAVSLIKTRGFTHYEISNFARAGHQCVHNLNYWRGGEYLGLGPAAASHLGGRRFKNKPDLDAYLIDPKGQICEVEELKNEEKAAEEAILRLRLLQEGLDINELIKRFGIQAVKGISERLNNLVEKDLIIRKGSNYRLEPACALVSNPILARVLGD
jgi:putative oxygen-independent coproporphyrinogen III oxidase